jgi:hypothetical protein
LTFEQRLPPRSFTALLEFAFNGVAKQTSRASIPAACSDQKLLIKSQRVVPGNHTDAPQEKHL